MAAVNPLTLSLVKLFFYYCCYLMVALVVSGFSYSLYFRQTRESLPDISLKCGLTRVKEDFTYDQSSYQKKKKKLDGDA